MSGEDLIQLVIRAAEAVARRDGISLPEGPGPDTALFGERGLFDSLGLVSLVLAVEEAIQDGHAVTISLADERAMSQTRSPFRTVQSLAEYAGQLVEQQGARPR
jgi:acyl carrier protein